MTALEFFKSLSNNLNAQEPEIVEGYTTNQASLKQHVATLIKEAEKPKDARTRSVIKGSWLFVVKHQERYLPGIKTDDETRENLREFLKGGD